VRIVRTLKNFQGTHILGASRGLLCDSSAVLFRAIELEITGLGLVELDLITWNYCSMQNAEMPHTGMGLCVNLIVKAL